MYTCIFCDNFSGRHYMICNECENTEEIRSVKKKGFDNGFSYGINIAIKHARKNELTLFVHSPEHVPFPRNFQGDFFWYKMNYREGFVNGYEYIKLNHRYREINLYYLILNHEFKENMLGIVNKYCKHDLFEKNIIPMIKNYIFPDGS